MNRLSYIRGLRELATFLENKPGVPVPELPTTVTLYQTDPEEFKSIIRALGMANKVELAYSVGCERQFGAGSVKLEVLIGHERVCERVVVGTRTELVPPEDAELVEQDVDVVEWRCPESFLA